MALPSYFVWLVFQSVCVHSWTALAYQNYCLLRMVLSYAVTARRWNIAVTTVKLSNFLCYRNVYHGNFFPFYLLPCSLSAVLLPLWQFRCHVCWGNITIFCFFFITVSVVIFEDQEASYPCFLWWFLLRWAFFLADVGKFISSIPFYNVSKNGNLYICFLKFGYMLYTAVVDKVYVTFW